MDLMFEEDSDEVGSDVEAYCPKCKADTTHVVISKYEDEIRRVQCNPCGDVHSYRKPRGEVEDDVPEPIAAKKRAQLKKLNWDEFFAKHGNKAARPYEFRELYKENLIVDHPKFGKGFVSEVVSDSKVEITFKDARRILVHNRKDIPGLPLAAEGDGVPTPKPIKVDKPAKGKDGKSREAQPPAAPTASAVKKPELKPEARIDAKVETKLKNGVPAAAKNGAASAPAKAAPSPAKPAVSSKTSAPAVAKKADKGPDKPAGKKEAKAPGAAKAASPKAAKPAAKKPAPKPAKKK